MNTTPLGNRTHIGIFGKRNAGKSSLINAMTEQRVSIVSDIGGTTADPVKKSMELLPYGPVTFIDTAGLDDSGELGDIRKQRTSEMFSQIDFALIVHDILSIDYEFEKNLVKELAKYSVPYIVVINKADTGDDDLKRSLQSVYKNAVLVSTRNRESILGLKTKLIERLVQSEEKETLIGDLLPYGSNIIMVVPIDSEAPKGRLILPQVQLIRDALDHGIMCHLVRDTELEDALKLITKPDLVVTDSNIFKEVSGLVPEDIPLTSFSILFARQKGDLRQFEKGLQAIEKLPASARILIAEVCTHSTSHEDIGRYKIPALLKGYAGDKISFDFFQGNEYPNNIEDYDLVVHCGGCMITQKQMQNRLELLKNKNIPVINYGILLAYGAQITDRALAPFNGNE